jgi:hypothetical protein
MSDVPLGSDRLRDRLVLAAVNALTKDDPLLMIGVGDNEIRLGWNSYCNRCGIPHSTPCKRPADA